MVTVHQQTERHTPVLKCAWIMGLQERHVPDLMPGPISQSSLHGLVGDYWKNLGAAWPLTALAAC